MKNTLTTLVFALLSIGCFAKNDHAEWDALLKKHVSAAGKVNYKKFKTDVAKLDAYLKEIAADAPASSWTANEKKAYWINAYNAYTVKMILDHYPIKSIKDIKIAGKDAWKHEWIKIGSETLSLSEIEDKKLREAFKDARIHFAINCASKSCPMLYNKAFTSSNVEAALVDLTTKFVNNAAQNKITAKSIQISELFNWYAVDFKTSGTVIDFLNKYSKVKIESGATIAYLKYDWNINE